MKLVAAPEIRNYCNLARGLHALKCSYNALYSAHEREHEHDEKSITLGCAHEKASMIRYSMLKINTIITDCVCTLGRKQRAEWPIVRGGAQSSTHHIHKYRILFMMWRVLEQIYEHVFALAMYIVPQTQ